MAAVCTQCVLSDLQVSVWWPLMEKCYAKLHGCYEAIDGGLSAFDGLKRDEAITFFHNRFREVLYCGRLRGAEQVNDSSEPSRGLNLPGRGPVQRVPRYSEVISFADLSRGS